MSKTLRELNKENKYTKEQLMSWKKFKDKYLNVYNHHYDYWVDGKGYVTVYEVRDMSETVRENFMSVDEILNH